MKRLLLWLYLVQACGAPHVTCQFKGQLGNQMFEVAAALAYAWDHDGEASFSSLLSAMNGQSNYQHVFHRLSIAPFPNETEFLLHHHDDYTNSHVYAPIPDFLNQNVMIDGHCVSEKYFARYREKIWELFAPSDEIVAEIRAKYGSLLKETTVAVHVRTFLPDHFLTLCHTPYHLQPLRWYYYSQAMQRFGPDVHFLIFSDDVEWTRRNFPKLPYKMTFIEGNPGYFDLYFISLCDHQIVSPDSTFSWWGAWLNRNPNKIVIAPSSWWDLKQHDVIPDGWIQIPRFPSW